MAAADCSINSCLATVYYYCYPLICMAAMVQISNTIISYILKARLILSCNIVQCHGFLETQLPK